MGDADLSKRFGSLHIDYYNKSVHSPNAGGFEVHAGDASWRGLFPTQDIYIVELNESYVVPKDYFVADALAALAAEFDIAGRSSMNKDDLVSALSEAGATADDGAAASA